MRDHAEGGRERGNGRGGIEDREKSERKEMSAEDYRREEPRAKE